MVGEQARAAAAVAGGRWVARREKRERICKISPEEKRGDERRRRVAVPAVTLIRK